MISVFVVIGFFLLGVAAGTAITAFFLDTWKRKIQEIKPQEIEPPEYRDVEIITASWTRIFQGEREIDSWMEHWVYKEKIPKDESNHFHNFYWDTASDCATRPDGTVVKSKGPFLTYTWTGVREPNSQDEWLGRFNHKPAPEWAKEVYER